MVLLCPDNADIPHSLIHSLVPSPPFYHADISTYMLPASIQVWSSPSYVGNFRADLKFVATVATSSRVNFFQLCKFFQKTTQFLTYFASLHTP